MVCMDDLRATAALLHVELDSLDLDSIQLPDGENFGIIRYDEDLNHKEDFTYKSDFSNIIVVDNLPVVPEEKFEKLQGLVTKIYSQIGHLKKDGLWMPVDPDPRKTLGYCFIEYNTPQYWTESFVQWSPMGTYLATLHRRGVAVWGGAFTFNRLTRYEHHQVKLIDFSPDERFLVTYSSQEPSHPRDTHMVLIIIYDVRSGEEMSKFSASADEFASSGVSWPVFRWGGGRENKYCARIVRNAIHVYETETFSLIGKEPIRVVNVADFSWSPCDSLLALFIPESGGGNQPARVSLVQIPSKQELRQKNLFSVGDCKMHWQSDGIYLAVKVDRYTKTKKSTYTSFELFRIKERDIPVEVLELENKNDKVIAFAWEPKGHRFAVIHGDNPRPDVSFYSICSVTNTGRVSKLTTLKGKQANALYWSPSGRFIVMAGLKGFNGQLEFYNVDELETMAQVEHSMATDVEWDPTGRFLVTAVTSVHEMENGFNVWSFNGKLLYRILKDHFFQFLWRPRHPSFLTGEEEEEIAGNLNKYSKRYDEDEDVCMLLSEQYREKRKMLKEEWERWVSEWKRLHEEDKLESRSCVMGNKVMKKKLSFFDQLVLLLLFVTKSCILINLLLLFSCYYL